jgi:hypothetical protein
MLLQISAAEKHNRLTFLFASPEMTRPSQLLQWKNGFGLANSASPILEYAASLVHQTRTLEMEMGKYNAKADRSAEGGEK